MKWARVSKGKLGKQKRKIKRKCEITSIDKIPIKVKLNQKIPLKALIIGSSQRAEDDVEHEVGRDTKCRWYAWNSLQIFGKKTQKNGISGRIETIQITDRVKYWEESWKREETCCHSDSSQRRPANVGGITLISKTAAQFQNDLLSGKYCNNKKKQQKK